MKRYYFYAGWLLTFALITGSLVAQEQRKYKKSIFGFVNRWTEKAEKREEAKPTEKLTFASPVLINNQTVKNLNKKTLDFTIHHRFGIISDEKDAFGLFSPANIRLGLNYGITRWLTVGLGLTKFKHIYDAQWKVSLVRQTKEQGMPVSITYFGNIGRSNLPNSNFYNQRKLYEGVDRLTYFNEIMVARKFDEHLSLQLAAKYAHLNYITVGMKHDVLGVSFAGRYKFTKQSSAIFEFDYPVTKYDVNPQKPNLSIGYEISTGGHQFQVFVGTADGILDAQILGYNQNDLSKRQVLLGFNITRLWNLKKQEQK